MLLTCRLSLDTVLNESIPKLKFKTVLNENIPKLKFKGLTSGIQGKLHQVQNQGLIHGVQIFVSSKIRNDSRDLKICWSSKSKKALWGSHLCKFKIKNRFWGSDPMIDSCNSNLYKFKIKE